jgi:hypothetical protein
MKGRFVTFVFRERELGQYAGALPELRVHIRRIFQTALRGQFGPRVDHDECDEGYEHSIPAPRGAAPAEKPDEHRKPASTESVRPTIAPNLAGTRMPRIGLIQRYRWDRGCH